jgi:peptidoglycan/LPS O-acetylase OafA/YrhL
VTSAAPAPRQRFEGGDPLRAFAAVTVFVFHAAYFCMILPSQPGLWFGDGYGAVLGRALGHFELGLYVFFVLSGYLISRPFVGAIVRGGPLPDLARYGVHRVARIVPAFWVVLVGLLIWKGSLGASHSEIVAQFAFGQNYQGGHPFPIIGQAWTLDLEAIFYCLVPLGGLVLARALRGGSERSRARALLVSCAVVFAASLVARAVVPAGVKWQLSMPVMLCAFMPGVALAAIETIVPATLVARADFARRLALALLALAVAAAVVYALLPPRVEFPPRTSVLAGLFAALASGALVGAVLVRQWAGLSPWRVLVNKPAAWLGARSYSFYLLHQTVIIELAQHRFLGRGAKERLLVLGPAAFVLTLIGAAVIYQLVEAPILRLAHARFGRGVPVVAAS